MSNTRTHQKLYVDKKKIITHYFLFIQNIIAAKPCEDLKGSAQCGKWKFSCESNKAFMKKQCKKTCGIC